MRDWDQLVSVAVVGTERKPLAPELVDRVGALVDIPLGGTGDEVTVLTAAAAIAAYRRAGVRTSGTPVQAELPAPAPAPDDERPEAPPAATQLLELLLDGHVKVPGGPGTYAAEWLSRCASSGRRVPARLLPRLLDHGTRSRDLRPGAVAAGGPRLTWLAARNPAWSWAATLAGQAGVVAGDAEVWRTGEHLARMDRLLTLRSADPEWALALVEETWAGEKARDRGEILDVLHNGLGPHDEDFLERALDDRAESVRRTAVDLLASLPGSGLGQRMTDRLRPLVALTGRRRQRLEAALPAVEPDAAARRDGIGDQHAPPGSGRRAWWLVQLVGATPLGFWTDELGLSPQDAVRAAGDEHPELLDGWAIAARRHRAGAWARELVRHRPDPALLRALDPEDAWTAAEAALAHASDGALPSLLAAVAPEPSGSWPPALGKAAVVRLRKAKNSVAVEQGLTVVAASADPTVVPQLEEWLVSAGQHGRVRHHLRAVVHAVTIRQSIAEELA